MLDLGFGLGFFPPPPFSLSEALTVHLLRGVGFRSGIRGRVRQSAAEQWEKRRESHFNPVSSTTKRSSWIRAPSRIRLGIPGVPAADPGHPECVQLGLPSLSLFPLELGNRDLLLS